jgi:hypothetical protein
MLRPTDYKMLRELGDLSLAEAEPGGDGEDKKTGRNAQERDLPQAQAPSAVDAANQPNSKCHSWYKFSMLLSGRPGLVGNRPERASIGSGRAL